MKVKLKRFKKIQMKNYDFMKIYKNPQQNISILNVYSLYKKNQILQLSGNQILQLSIKYYN